MAGKEEKGVPLPNNNESHLTMITMTNHNYNQPWIRIKYGRDLREV